MAKWEVKPERENLHRDCTHISIDLANETRAALGVRSAHTTATDEIVGLGEDEAEAEADKSGNGARAGNSVGPNKIYHGGHPLHPRSWCR